MIDTSAQRVETLSIDMQMNPIDKTHFLLPPPFAEIRNGFIFAMDADSLKML